MSLGRRLKLVVTDSHFLVPFAVLLAGIALLIVLH
ncbi:translocated intimin receptor Tir [Granulicella sp. dw_53]|nr:translocated intimin receptor Tir [Granulicella sp. dw_53]